MHRDYNNPYTLTNMHNLHKITNNPYTCATDQPTYHCLSCTPRGYTHRNILYRSIQRVEMCLVCRTVLCTPDTSLRTTGTWFFSNEYFGIICFYAQNYVHRCILMLPVISISCLYGCHYLLLTCDLVVTPCMSVGCGGFVYLCITYT